jgi:mono/diheme cytochrome c family protein
MVVLAGAGATDHVAWADQAAPGATDEAASPYGGGDAERGHQIFASNGCGWCHESMGRKPGRGPQLMNTKRSDEFIANRIAMGSPGRMPSFGQSMDDQKLRDLIAFIHSIKPEETTQ